MPKRINPYAPHIPSWLKHTVTALGTLMLVVSGGTLAWNNLEHTTAGAVKLAQSNSQKIEGVRKDLEKLDDKVDEIGAEQRVIGNEVGNIKTTIDRERQVQKERHEETKNTLDRILNSLRR